METTDNFTTGVPRDSSTESIWQASIRKLQHNSNHSSETVYDVLIVGGGITGLTTALLLQEAGKNCVLAEAHTIGFGTTGGTTAHINTFLDNSYNYIERDFGEDGSRLVAESCKAAVETVANLVNKYQIDCDFDYKKGYLYAESDQEAEELDKILEASQKAGVAVQISNNIPVPVPFKKAIVFDQQAQIHPLKYIYGLAEEFIKKAAISCKIQ